MNLRIEPEIKADAEELFGSFGLTVTDAVNVFLRQSLMRGGFPFEIVRHKPNAITQVADVDFSAWHKRMKEALAFSVDEELPEIYFQRSKDMRPPLNFDD